VCIDQANTTECSHQVDMMDEVYRKAKHVRLWFGAPETRREWRRFQLDIRVAEFLVKPTLPKPYGRYTTLKPFAWLISPLVERM
jgi:Heterokaryon incompatibility protein (HET)